jgi:acetyl-CoA synthetase
MSVSQVQDNYAALHQGFRWAVPAHFNMAEVCCRRWAAQPDADERIAIHAHQSDGQGPRYSYAQLQHGANRLSAVLTVLGVQRGDRVAIVLPQRFETAVAYMAVLQMGAVGMPLSTLFGPEALEYRLQDSEARVAICDASACVDAINQVRDDCPLAGDVIGVGEASRIADIDFDLALAQESGQFDLVTPMPTRRPC